MPHKGYEWPEGEKPDRVKKMLKTRKDNKAARDKAWEKAQAENKKNGK